MKLIANTVLQIEDSMVCYEVYVIGQMLVFKPYFYHLEEPFPCIVLRQVQNGWQFQSYVCEVVEQQICDELNLLQVNAYPLKAA